MDKPAPEHNVLVTQFGQMIAHDTELTFPKLSGEFLMINEIKFMHFTVNIKYVL